MENILQFFKPHIVCQNGKYLVRKFTFIGFKYLDESDDYWWYSRKTYIGRFDTIEDAEKRYEKRKNKVVKIL